MRIRPWSELPVELLRMIAERLELTEDFVRFSAVCQSWRFFTTLNKSRFSSILNPPLPWLMFNDGKCKQGFYSVSENRTYRVSLPEEARGRHRCWGSPFGWLLTLGSDHEFHLLNPLSHSRLPLPPLSAFPDYNLATSKRSYNPRAYIFGAVVLLAHSYSSTIGDQNNGGFVVFAIYGENRSLAFARPGDRTWTTVKFPRLSSQCDVLQLNGKFYSVDSCGSIWLCDITGSGLMAIELVRSQVNVDMVNKTFYLLELRGKLHMAVKIVDFELEDDKPIGCEESEETAFIEIYKLDLFTRTWKKLKTLGNYSIFIGTNTSISVNASDYPRCKPGCVYFIDSNAEIYERLVGPDMGIFNLETGNFELLHGDRPPWVTQPVWITPKLL